MKIKQYISNFRECIDKSPVTYSHEIVYEERYSDILYISGFVTFIDISRLDLKEYIIFRLTDPNYVKYAYNYMDSENRLVFRYDNAMDPKARDLPAYPEHKHTLLDGITAAHRPSFLDVLDEIKTIIITGEKG